MTFSPRIFYGDIELTAAPYMVEFGFDLGNATTAYEVVESMVVDGTVQSATGTVNRTLSISVLIEQSDSAGLAAFGSDLGIEAGKESNTLTFMPGDGFGPASVLETYAADVTHDWDQDLEQAGLRRYVLTIPAVPYTKSVDPVVINWTGPGTELNPLTSLTGWTVVSGSAVIAGGVQGFETTTTATLRRTFTVDEYLWIKLTGDLLANPNEAELYDVKVDGTEIPFAQMRKERPASNAHFYTIPVGEWRGQSVTVEFTLAKTTGTSVTMAEFWTVSYPNRTVVGAATSPIGIGAISPIGSARAGCTIAFTSPSGGAFVYTAPDPNASIRDRGAAEMTFLYETTVDPPDNYLLSFSALPVQPVALYPNGVWPQGSFGTKSYVYPADTRAAVTYFNTTGAKNVISATAALRQGYKTDAIAHEEHVLHPGRCGFAVLDQDGAPIAATITYYPHWWSHAAQ